jgi:glycine cleavage system H lipoate-binding protein
MVRGIKASEIANLLASGKPTDWSDSIKGGNPGAVKIHMAGSEDIKAAVADFTGTDASVMNVSVVEEPGKIISVIEKDINSIGFSKLADLMKDNGNELAGNIVFLPIDRNGNGRIDSFEKIYGNPEELTRGIWIGKYPSSLCGSIYALSSEKPAGKDQVAFLKWILTDGSQHLASKGYISLLGMETESGLVALTGTPINAVTDVRPSNYYAGIIIIASITALVILISVLITRAAKSKKVPAKTVTHVRSAFNEEAIASPGGLLFDKSHTWTFMERDGLIRFGIDDFIQNVTGALTGIRLKETGEFVRRGEKILSIVKDGKQIDLYSPVSGTIKSLNTNLSIDPSLVNSSPYTDGWIYLIEPRNWAREMQLMFMADKYRQWITDEFDRLKTFLSSVPRENSTCAHVILQDGGELTHNVLGDMEPEVWAEFQTRFIDTSR